MPDEHNADGDEGYGDGAAPSGLTDGKPASGSGKHPQPTHTGHGASGNDKPPSYKTLWREIRWLDVINAIVAIAMLVVAIATYRVATDTSDVKNAVRNISELAKQTKRQADNSDAAVKGFAAQFGEMQKQTAAFQISATAAQGQVREMRDEQRPIVDVATIENATPLQTDPVIGAFIKFNVVNSGKSVAILAYPHAKLILNTADSEVLKKTKEACYASVRGPDGTTPIGFNLRVGVTIPMAAGYVLTPEETATWKARPDLRMLLVGCIDYMFDRRHHHAPFVQEVDRKDATAPEGWSPINPNKDKVDTGGLVFLTPPWYSPEPD